MSRARDVADLAREISSSADATAITIDANENVTLAGNLETATNKKIKQKGSFMQSSTHQALVLGG
tara:strand:- start:5087 stop:5281 length:195 start_codon:yes stop_codon:yes gene_type:complete